ncbi:Na+/H+ antiporter subunit A [Sediminivirga luteola]|uniref:Na+/H+ antiporter subunit A n=1 Tax=Sediminivirga luteola TaxID=1774748 RepID=UPI001F580F2E|nr:Na+/H+ antiporter subunit A [Sediminivirga luteola]MCI2264457.1 Na+/H+ antiporter subunit A [Sediminivirga luteola]
MAIVLLVMFMAAAFAPLLFRYVGRNAFFFLAFFPLAGFFYTLYLGTLVTPERDYIERFRWVADLQMDIVLRTDALSWVMSLLVTGVGFLVMIYCARYFSPSEQGLGRFGAVLMAFAGMMYGLVVADNIYMLFLFWEGTTIFSYLLIGHANARKQSRRAALQALIVTTSGGLAMLVGLVMLHVLTGTASLVAMVNRAPAMDLGQPVIIVAIVLVLVGAVSKSALVPFHFWLPGAMAAPTPVSAYLHAAAMVKAGIYLVLRMAPGFAETPGWVPLCVLLGVLTMLVGGWRALRQTDLKLVLAFGTVSQLGFLTLISAFGTRNTALAALALLLAHGLFKATLFLVVGVIDHRTGTRDLRKLSGLGRQAPVLTVIGVIAALSMAGLPPLFGFVAKEAVYSSLLELGTLWGTVAVIGVFLGSVLTVAYSLRFIWGAFARKDQVKECRYAAEHFDFLLAPTVLALLTVAAGFAAPAIDGLLAGHADPLPGTGYDYHLALWHGLEPALFLSAANIAIGVLLFLGRARVEAAQARVPAWIDLHAFYRTSMGWLEKTASRVTAKTQRGSLPFYQGVILAVLVAALIASLFMLRQWPAELLLFEHPAEVLLLVLVGAACIAAAWANKRFMAVVVVGVVGYGMVVFYAMQGAPDLALTQVLVETITLVVFVLVLRRLPARIGEAPGRIKRWLRAALGAVVGTITVVTALVVLGARQAEPISNEHPRMAYEGGHGMNVVNVILVDIRAWDTFGELAVIVVAATGVASLIFITNRTARLQRLDGVRPEGFAARHRMIDDTFGKGHRPPVAVLPAETDTAGGQEKTLEQLRAEEADRERRSSRNAWLVAGRTLAPQNRSIILEVIVRLLFHSVIVFSLFLLFAGHNSPGGGFAAGLVAGLALILRYLAGGRFELAEAAPIDAGRALGLGLAIVVGMAAAGFFFDGAVLSSTWFSWDIPLLGHVEFVTTTLFDVGVYLIVVGLMLDVLRSLGAEVDRQQEEDHERAQAENVLGEREMASRLAARDAAHGSRGPKGGNRL